MLNGGGAPLCCSQSCTMRAVWPAACACGEEVRIEGGSWCSLPKALVWACASSLSKTRWKETPIMAMSMLSSITDERITYR